MCPLDGPGIVILDNGQVETNRNLPNENMTPTHHLDSACRNWIRTSEALYSLHSFGPGGERGSPVLQRNQILDTS